jgi:hypothetical protein
MSKWADQYKDSRWQKKRLEVMERAGWVCEECGATGDGVTLNVHHLYYETGKAPWEYPGDALLTLCETCHAETHALQKTLQSAIIASGLCVDAGLRPLLKELIGYCHAYEGPSVHSGEEYERGFASQKLMPDTCVAGAICKAHAMHPGEAGRPL